MTRKNDEPEITVESILPTPIAPPLETDVVAVAVEDDDDGGGSSHQASFENTKMCTVVAPSTLSAGYTFTAQVDGIDFVVAVPEGGVAEGQHFQVPYPREGTYANHHQEVSHGQSQPTPMVAVAQPPQNQNAGDELAPMGHWRDELCDCFGVICNGMFWNALICTPVIYGQLMQRLHLNAIGLPSENESYKRTFMILVIVWVVFLVFCAAGIARFVFYLFSFFMWAVFTNTRYYYRQRYNISVSSCECCDGRFNDFCCGLFCSCCVAIQLSRHTHDHRRYPYQCCAPTGLSVNAPEIV
jgi:Cys-rich protein (TIGR01571 family)